MAIPENISRKHLEKAIEEIVPNKIPPQRLEQHYALVEYGKELPPKYVVSRSNLYANGNELDYDAFNSIEANNFLKRNNFNVIDRRIQSQLKSPQVWIEKTEVEERLDRKEGDRALGRALWSPRVDKRGYNIYKNMTKVKEGDIVLHLIDNKKFSGVSVAESSFTEVDGLANTKWDRPAYLIRLKNYIVLDPEIDRSEILNKNNAKKLHSISNGSEVFYNRDLKLREGAYLTPCPDNLFTLINNIYKSKTNNNLPNTENLNFRNPNNDEPTELITNSNDDSVHDTTGHLSNFDISTLHSSLSKAELKINESLVVRFVASIMTKPFVIFTGLSGSGKTKLAQAFAMWICEDDSQYCIAPVGADWTNREPLLGFPNALDKESYIPPDNEVLDLIFESLKPGNEKKPYFLILDEMNLSHVERYFADFLSVMETKDEKGISLYSDNERKDTNGKVIMKKFKLPDNLFIVGTVNIDETTYMFSPKVLDRANVIEFRVTKDEMVEYLKNPRVIDLKEIKSKGKDMAGSFTALAKDQDRTFNESGDLNKSLLDFFDELKNAGAEFGYRTAGEINRFAAIIKMLDPLITTEQITDFAIMQKLLPKLHGSKRKLEPVLRILLKLCLKDPSKSEDYLSEKAGITEADLNYPVSAEKIRRMYKNLMNNGFTSYAET